MSGVMTKVAVYGFVRIVFDLLGMPAWWWSIPVLAIGGITAVMGVLYALMQHDLKRLLAYHTVENIGIIFIGLGLALAFKAHGMAVAAALALTAGLLHVFNHSVFKSLLFFGAGAVLNATGERDMEHLGGLIHRLCIRVADVPGDSTESTIAFLGSEISRTGRGSFARVISCTGRRMFCKGIWRQLPWARAHCRSNSSTRNR
jgi:formate hydrogenlyase subunit 3/multisubunit Na+/H+ antiporter MnhD subunit